MKKAILIVTAAVLLTGCSTAGLHVSWAVQASYNTESLINTQVTTPKPEK